MSCHSSSAIISNTNAASTPFSEPRTGLTVLFLAVLDGGEVVDVGKSLFLTTGLKQRCTMQYKLATQKGG